MDDIVTENYEGVLTGVHISNHEMHFASGTVVTASWLEDCSFFGTNVRFDACKFDRCDLSSLTFSHISNSTLSWSKIYPDEYIGGNSIVETLAKICPAIETVVRSCPACKVDRDPCRLSGLIPHLNDQHKWSREKIADWLDIIALDDPEVDLTVRAA